MEIFIVNVYLLLLEINVKVVYFIYYLFFSLFLVFFLKKKSNNEVNKKKGGLEIGEQTILMNFYNSLTSNGTLNWDLSTDLCGQNGVTCDSSIPKRVIQLYLFLSFFSLFSFFFPEDS